jgi:thioredoxin
LRVCALPISASSEIQYREGSCRSHAALITAAARALRAGGVAPGCSVRDWIIVAPFNSTSSCSTGHEIRATGETHHANSRQGVPSQPVLYSAQVNTEQFEEEIQDTSTPIVVDIFAVWCGPCQLMAPQLEQVAEQYDGKCRFLKIDSDEEPEVATVLKINGLPTTLLINDMTVVARAEGMLMAKEISSLVDHHFFAGPAPEMEGTA